MAPEPPMTAEPQDNDPEDAAPAHQGTCAQCGLKACCVLHCLGRTVLIILEVLFAILGGGGGGDGGGGS